MRTASRIVGIAALLVGLGLAGTSMLAETGGDRAVAEAGEECCFTNPRYTGTCRVVPGEDETCGSILAYLNNPNSAGKSYCGNTRIRGGWRQVSCDEATLVGAAAECRP